MMQAGACVRVTEAGWMRRSALGGGAGWALLAVAAAAGILDLGVIEALFLLAPLVVVPLGLALVWRDDPAAAASVPGRAAARLQAPAAVMAALSFLLPAGSAAALLAVGWFVFTACAGLVALEILVHPRGPRSVADACIVAGLGYLPVGGAGLVLSRAGLSPMGFVEPIVLLTAVHFHFTAFASPLIAGATGRTLRRAFGDEVVMRRRGGAAGNGVPSQTSIARAAGVPGQSHRARATGVPGQSRLARAARALFFPVSAGLIGGPALLAAGWATFTPALKVVAALVLAASHLGLAALACAALPALRPLAARALVAVSAAALGVGMILAAVYAVGEFQEVFVIGIPAMARVHGAANGLGFALCGLMGWNLTRTEDGHE